MNRRDWMKTAAALGVSGVFGCDARAETTRKAQIAITLDLEMSRNFPHWDDTHWDYEKGNLNDDAKKYAVAAGERVKTHGGRIHYFCVGRVLEQPDVAWLQKLAQDGHPIGNHTYDHVYLLAKTNAELQFRFQRAPWLIEGRSTADVLRENIRLTTLGLKHRIGIDNRGFRTPGGFANGLKGREDLQQMLLDNGFHWVSSLYPPHADTKPKEQPTEAVYQNIVDAQAKAQPFVYPTGLVEIPMCPISDIGAFRTGQWKLEWFLEAVRRAVTWAIEHKAVFDFLAHPSCLGVVDSELKTIDLICDLVKKAGNAAEFANLDQIAAKLTRP
ncbi:MAG: polysaccharide deacetylase family protein [Planctomycetaceae bacterium]|nr:polysaccharide deacetylase family protein [Planctomycetaceae bacterium]